MPFATLVVPETSALHLSAYAMTIIGKFMCYAIAALALDLVWGYCGILSLGHALFFALGGYAIGMYLMRSIGREGKYGSDLPDFMVFLDWHQLPWYWQGTAASRLRAAAGGAGAGSGGVGVRLLHVPLAREGRVPVDHHAGHDLRRDAAVLSQRNGLRRQ